ncbi:hypothetical protein [Arthrobacter sp. H16F315]|uniref:hypothetical protein n=1 Tax=Arthrobacter sp. H16F315 TaxID=2955314 RepID=UPI00209823D4|nr:hypothetical protein [Arthrobacter sp. H16F315]MDD1478001.1 hypothetical protein [Arthrobacter sp. H16F315]
MADAARQDPAASVSVRELPDRGRVFCHGFIESVTYAPASQVAAFTAIVVDHNAPPVKKRSVAVASGAAAATPASGLWRQRSAVPKDRLRVVWLGRRRIPGVDAGTELRLQGMVTVRDGLPTMFNPRYEILSPQEEQ